MNMEFLVDRTDLRNCSWKRCLALCLIVLVFGQTNTFAQFSKVVILVRHAEKADTPAGNPVLSEQGDLRARALARRLTHTEIDHIITSHLDRTLLTAQYVAENRGLTPQVVRVDSGIDAHVQAVAEAVRSKPAGSAILVVGHSNTIPAILKELGGPDLGNIPDGSYSDLFIMILSENGRARTVHAAFD